MTKKQPKNKLGDHCIIALVLVAVMNSFLKDILKEYPVQKYLDRVF